MSKKFDEIKNNIVAPFQQMSNLFGNNSNNLAMAKIKSCFMQKLAHSPHSFSATITSSAVGSGGIASNSQQPVDKYSFAYDTRLDTSVYQTLENDLFIRVTHQDDAINLTLDSLNNIFAATTTAAANAAATLDSVEATISQTTTEPSSQKQNSISLIQQTLESLFQDLSNINLENLLTFWLTLNNSDLNASTSSLANTLPASSSACLFQIKDSTINYLLDTLCAYPLMTVKLWHLTFRTLVLLFGSVTSPTSDAANEPLLYRLVLKYLREPSVQDDRLLMGDECNQAFVDFLGRLVAAADQAKKVHSNLFGILNKLIDSESSGAMANCARCLDSQVAYVDFLLSLPSQPGLESEVAEAYMANLAHLVQRHLHLSTRLAFKGQLSPRSCFSSVLTTLLLDNGSASGNGSSHSKSGNSKSVSSSANIFDSLVANSGLNGNAVNSDNNNAANKIKTPSVLCNQDLFVCLLLKYAIFLINSANKAAIKGSTNGGKAYRRAGDSRTVLDQQQQQQQQSVHRKHNVIVEEENEDELNDEFDEEHNYFEEDYEDEEEDMEATATPPIPDVEEEVVLESATVAVEEEYGNTNEEDESELVSVPNPMLTGLSNKCLELFVESLALCQSSALAMVISNSGYPIELTIQDIRTSGDGLFLLLKTIGNFAPLRLVEPCFAYFCKIRRLSEPLLWLLAGLFNDAQFSNAFIYRRNGIEIISKGMIFKNFNLTKIRTISFGIRL